MLDKYIDISDKGEGKQTKNDTTTFVCNMTLENTLNGFYDDIYKRDTIYDLNKMKDDVHLGFTCDKTIQYMIGYK